VKLDQLILMVGFNLAMTVAIVVKLFAGIVTLAKNRPFSAEFAPTSSPLTA
jgi:hypothetical protein